MKEAQVQKGIMQFLGYHPRVVPMFWRNNTGAITIPNKNVAYKSRFIRFGKVGSADILGILWNGRMLAIEVKAGKNKTTKRQQAFIDNINTAGGLGFVARSIDDVDEVLRIERKKMKNSIMRNPNPIGGDLSEEECPACGEILEYCEYANPRIPDDSILGLRCNCGYESED